MSKFQLLTEGDFVNVNMSDLDDSNSIEFAFDDSREEKDAGHSGYAIENGRKAHHSLISSRTKDKINGNLIIKKE